MRISIIIPIYNVEPYIERCLLSVYAQTYSGEIEVIIVDDCGTDNSMDIAREVSKPYQELFDIKFLRHDKNRGLSAARNSGVDVAMGEYIYFLDSDDYVTDDCIETLVGYVVKYPGVDLVQGSFCRVNGEDRRYVYPNIYPEYLHDKEYIMSILLEAGHRNIPITAWNKLIRVDFLRGNGLRFKEGIVYEDMHLNFYIAQSISSICFCYEPTYNYLIRGGSIMDGLGSIFSIEKNILYNDFIDDISDLYPEIQRRYIFDTVCVHYLFGESHEQHENLAKSLNKISKKSNFQIRFAILLILNLPIYILQKKIIFNRFLIQSR